MSPGAEMAEEYQIWPRAALAEGPAGVRGAAGRVLVTLRPCTGIVGCGTARSFALGKAVIGEGRAAPEGEMVPQRRWRPVL